MKIQVLESVVDDRESRDGQYKFREQVAYANVFDRDGRPVAFPQKIVISLDKGGAAYPKGEYTVADSSYYIDPYGKLQVGSLKLVPVGKA